MARKSKRKTASQTVDLRDSLPLELQEACHELGIEPQEVMSYRVYADQVVMIVGPVGRKVIWPMEQIRRGASGGNT